ncbi:type II secretion system secretin GspD [Thermomonas sp. S9]|uniref:Type II secretion system protein D (GspD) n=1 Tax=Thermomonas haemolytica TaxID=141949 RepID=A0A4R3MVI1_9GAMM|nr:MULTISPECIES: type II secretion system secretin GspD [Thermomonas]MCR6494875.1 type II secretion system secretin GspD [Thermomonas sp. S9]TCT20540.1 type II secretion system protein D (GspD) [Thermomonas haemolytica]TNY28932.1 type II secretion system protein GspD [Thermomonas haemolytica]
MNRLMNRTPSLPSARPFLLALAAMLLAACASVPQPQLHRGAQAAQGAAAAQDLRSEVMQELGSAGPQPVIRRGSGEVINRAAASAPPPAILSSGQASFNFEGESLQAVVKAILGDMLGQSYSIAPGVQGTVTVATQKPVGAAGALSLLEQVLAQNGARMVYSDGRYNIVPADQALQSGAVPRNVSPALARGFESRVVPLRYIAAAEMEKILKPYARPGAIVSVDGARNLITIAGSRAELENYLRTIQVFDVDWMASMSVGVFPLQSGRAVDVVQDLERVFGEQGKTPVAGMFRFMPLESTNAVMVITPQASYLDEIRQWIDRIEGGSGDNQLFSYELKYIKARDLADRLAEVFGGSGGGRDEAGALMPGVQATDLRSGGGDARAQDAMNADAGAQGASAGGLGQGAALPQARAGNGRVTLKVGGAEVGVSAVEDTNSLLVRASPAQWKSIRDVIERLDVMPMQVQIEAQVVSVALKGALQYGVSWYFDNALAGQGLPYPTGRNSYGSYSGSLGPMANGGGNLLSWTFLGSSAAAIIQALDNVTDVRTLSSPSVFTQNNKEAVLNVGQRIPVASVSFNPAGGTTGTYSQVQYLDTGIILKVRPRITRDGMVFLDIVQEVSKPTGTADANGNVRIDTSKVTTSAVAPSGETIVLAGLISDGSNRSSTGVPGLSRIPIVGSLFGQQGSEKTRDELVVLITPTVVRNPLEARNLTDEYGRRFRALDPIYAPKKK